MNGRSPSEQRRLALAEAIASSWGERSISYAVVHGLEVATAVACGRDHGFATVFFRWSHWGLYQLALVDPAESTALALDLLCTTDVWRAKLVRLVDRSQLDRIAAGGDQLGAFRISGEGRVLQSCGRPL